MPGRLSPCLRPLAAACLAAALWLPGPARADRFAVVERGTDEGLVQSQVRALMQDPQGFLWIATHAGGLDRFDGLQFRHHSVRHGLPSNLVLDVAWHDGHVYAATRLGLARLDEDGLFHEIPLPQGFDDPQINALAEDARGALWVATFSGLFRLEGGALAFVAQLGTVTRALAADGQGGMWAASDRGLHHLDAGGALTQVAGGDELQWVGRMAMDPAGGLWLGTKRGLFHADGQGGDLRAVPLEGSPEGGRIWALTVEEDGSLWVGTGAGVVHFSGDGRQIAWGAAEGLPDAPVTAILRDREGTLHLGTNGAGLASLPRVPFYTWSRGPLQDYAPTQPLWTRGDAGPGTLWIPTLGDGLWRLDGEDLTQLGPREGIPDGDVTFITQWQGALWVGMARGLAVSRGEGFGPPPGLPEALIDTPFLDAEPGGDGHLWMATGGGLVVWDGQRWEVLGPTTGFPANEPLTLAPTPDGDLWIGTQAAGAILWDPTSRAVKAHLRGGAELPSDTVTAVAQGLDGRWWLGTDRGIAVWDGERAQGIGWEEGLPEGYLYFLCADPGGTLWAGTSRGVARWTGSAFQVFTRGHGLPADEANSGACGVDPRGRLWLGTVSGYAIYDPAAQATLPPPDTLLLTATVGSEDLPMRGLVELSYDQNDLRWAYLSPTFIDPRGVSYQTRLLGYRDQWETTSQREVRFAALPPGQYTFEVRGCMDGACDPTPVTSAVLIIHPPWYTRTWAKVLGVLLVFSAGAAVTWVRARGLERRARLLEHLVDERTHELGEEKEKSDTLLLNVLPRQVVDELKDHGEVQPRRYPDVTILFTDLQGFTSAASQTDPERLVEELNDIFATFDGIAQAHGLEKLKTIGDAYMAVGGLPTPNTTHPIDAVTVGLEMQSYMLRRLEDPAAMPFKLRVGVHTGPVVAGVIGAWKYAYDIWGDAVNIASRMESGGAPGEVNISRATFERVQDAFDCEPRGRRQVKGKGEMDMYFVRQAKGVNRRSDAPQVRVGSGSA